jgi:hypothetical protein
VQPKGDHQDQPEPEARHRLADHRDELHQPVHPGILAHRRQDAERDGDDQRDGEAGQPERQGDRHALHDQVGGARLEEEALAEITDRRAADPVEELHRQRPVEPIGAADDLHILLRGAGAGDGDGEVARDAGEHEAEHHHRQGDEQRDDQATEGEAEHLIVRLGAMLRRGKTPQ